MTIEFSTMATFLLGVIAIMLGIVGWFLRRELLNNDKAHSELRDDLKDVKGDTSYMRGLLDAHYGRKD